MTAPALSARARQAQDYLAAVEHELADLPAEDRSALLEDLALHLEALAAEDDDRPVEVRLGPPAVYAADLRAAAGLPARGEVGDRSPGLRARLDAVLASSAYRRAEPALRGARRLLVDLRPAWWVLRGYLVVLTPCLLGNDYADDVPVPAPLHSHFLGALLVLAAVTGSVLLGRRKLPRPVGLAVTVAGVLLVLASIGAARSVQGDVEYRVNAAAWTPSPQVPDERYPLLSRYGPVTDVFPYAADGTPLEGVLLYDQDGRPLHVGYQQWWADGCIRVLDQPRAADDVPVPNSYPQSYELHPSGVGIDGAPVSPGRCTVELPRPEVPLPVFPAAGGDATGTTAPAPAN
jgi:hypothetical protein